MENKVSITFQIPSNWTQMGLNVIPLYRPTVLEIWSIVSLIEEVEEEPNLQVSDLAWTSWS